MGWKKEKEEEEEGKGTEQKKNDAMLCYAIPYYGKSIQYYPPHPSYRERKRSTVLSYEKEPWMHI